MLSFVSSLFLAEMSGRVTEPSRQRDPRGEMKVRFRCLPSKSQPISFQRDQLSVKTEKPQAAPVRFPLHNVSSISAPVSRPPSPHLGDHTQEPRTARARGWLVRDSTGSPARGPRCHSFHQNSSFLMSLRLLISFLCRAEMNRREERCLSLW